MTTTNDDSTKRRSSIWKKMINFGNCASTEKKKRGSMKMTTLVSSSLDLTPIPELADVSNRSSFSSSNSFSPSPQESRGGTIRDATDSLVAVRRRRRSSSTSAARDKDSSRRLSSSAGTRDASNRSSSHRQRRSSSSSTKEQHGSSSRRRTQERRGAVSASTTKSAGPLTTCLPPIHTCVLITSLLVFFLRNLPTWQSLDEIATLQTFTNTNFTSTPLEVVIAIRLLLAATMLGNALYIFCFGEWQADTQYFPNSKLQEVKGIPFRGALVPNGSWFSGFKCISSFTVWCWILEGSAFALAGMIPVVHQVLPSTLMPWILRLAIILWETAAPVTILVSAVVKFALWPMALERDGGPNGGNLKLLKSTGALLQHNLNTVAALFEVGLLGGLPVRFQDFVFPPLFGIAYLLFNYTMMYRWIPNPHRATKAGPQYFYPFFDTTLGMTTSLSLLGLLLILSLSFVVFCGATSLLKEAPDSPQGAVPIAAILLLSTGVCRFWD